MRKWLDLSRFPAVILFLAAGVCGGLFAWNSYNLLLLAMANYGFVQKFGRLALAEGALLQMLEIAVYGYVSLALYVGFKGCETELIERWRGRAKGG